MQKPAPPAANGELPHEEDPATDTFVTDASTQVPPQMHNNMNGGMPPQQVYVETMEHHHVQPPNGVNGLETQFQALGIQPGHDDDNYGEEDTEGNDEGGEGEDDPLKLFVGQVRS